MTFSFPRFAASKSYIFRARRLWGQPHSRRRSPTRSRPIRSMSRLVAVLSDTMIASSARSRSERCSTSRMCRSTPLPSTRSPTATRARPRFELATYMYALQTKGKIRIATLDNDAPFAVRDSSGTHAGFEVDLGRELAKAIFGPQRDIDSVIEWVSVDRGTAVTSVTSLQADVVIAKLAATPESASVIDLSDPYFISGERILVASTNDDIKNLADLDTKTVCVQLGSGLEAHLAAANDSTRILVLDTYASCIGALKA